MKFPILRAIAQLMFPVECIGCGAPVAGICATCIHSIPHSEALSAKHFAMFQYSHPLVRKSIRIFKYHHRSEAVQSLTRYMAPYVIDYMHSYIPSPTHVKLVLVPVPGDPLRTTRRGFIPSYYIARLLQKAIPGTILGSVLKKRVHTPPQAKLSRTQRARNISHTMYCSTQLDPTALYIVVDDILTTGTTAREAMRAMRERGARHILAIALAHG